MSGWKVNRDSRTFSPRQHKEMLSLVARDHCHQTLASSLSARAPHLGQTFALHQSELCAGGGDGGDVCQADGGAPLVCKAPSGRWSLVGLLTWALPGQHNPGVFLNVAHLMDWIISVQ